MPLIVRGTRLSIELKASGASMARNADEWKNDEPHFLFEMGDVMLMGDADA